MQELLSKVQRVGKELEQDLRRKPSRAEVAMAMGIEPEKIEEMYDYLQVGAGGVFARGMLLAAAVVFFFGGGALAVDC